MSAREMFEELGYKLTENNKQFIVYQIIYEKSIVFKPLIKMTEMTGSFTLKDFKAINKMIEELNWK